MAKRKSSDNTLLVIAIIAVLVAAIGLFLTYQNKITGFQLVDTGTVDVDIQTQTSIDFTYNTINWGAGSVTPPLTLATLDTSVGTSASGGDWVRTDGGTQGLILENVGSVNVSLKLSTTATAAGFIGGTQGGGPVYEFNVTNCNELGNGAGCSDGGGVSDTFPACAPALGFTLGTNVAATGADVDICNDLVGNQGLGFLNDRDQVRIDIRLVIPIDSKKGALLDTLTATAAAI